MTNVVKIHGREILDSRGNPTIEVDVILEDGSMGRASVPSGASTGQMEAVELRDQDIKRYQGLGVKKAILAVNNEIASTLIGMNACEQNVIDNTLIDLDNTKNKSRLGANSILATSLAIAKAAAKNCKMPLYKYIGDQQKHVLPVPLMNIINGGVHADNSIDIQEFMIVPVSSANLTEAVRMGSEIFHRLKDILKTAGFNTNVGDEGGFAPELKSSEQALDFIVKAIENSGYVAGKDVYLALDVAASELYIEGRYKFKGLNKEFSGDELIKYYNNLLSNYPVISLEDAMAEDDEEGWYNLTKELGGTAQLVGDDLFVTNPEILSAGIKKNLANAVLIKPNQIGTLTETLKAVEIARAAGYNAILSHRSGETEDTTIAHIAVATNCGQIKTGSLSRTDRLVKYNELMRIEEELFDRGGFAGINIFSKYI